MRARKHAQRLILALTWFPGLALGQAARPEPPGRLVDIGGQHLHVYCTGRGSPTVLLENGAGDFSYVWGLVQPRVSAFTRVCSYDRGGYAWSDPGTRPRTFAQLALELRSALDRLGVPGPYVLVGQSYGGLVVRGFAARYPRDVGGMVLVDAVHEDQRVVWGGEAHRIRDEARRRSVPEPRLGLDSGLLALARDSSYGAIGEGLDPLLQRLSPSAQAGWRWAQAQPLFRLAATAEMEWSPEELARMHAQRVADRATLGDLPLTVLARTRGEYPDGMSISADSLERERRELMLDLAHLSHRGRLIYAPSSGHNIHLEDPDLVVRAIREVVRSGRMKRG